MKKLAIWNQDRGTWEDWDGTIDLFSAHSESYSATWPSSGMTRNGVAYELPTPVLPITDTACSSSLLKTPTSQLAINGGSQHPDKRKAGGHGPTLADEVEHLLLPTPAASDGKRNDYPADRLRNSPNLPTISVYFPEELARIGASTSQPSPDGKP